MAQPTLATCRHLFGDVFLATGAAALDVAAITSDAAASAAVSAGAADDDGRCSSLDGNYNLGLHIAAIFIILAASAVGTLIPILGKHVPALRLHAYIYAVGKAMATGVVLAVALIHMINEAAGTFEQDCIPEHFREMYEGWAVLFAMIAAVLMHAVDGTVAWVVLRWSRRAAVADANSSASGAAVDVRRTEPCNDSLCKECVEPGAEAQQQGCADAGAALGDDAVVVRSHSEREHAHAHASGAECVGHQHGVAVPDDMPQVQRIVAALCMEFGVTLHSVFVGLALAVANGDDMRVLLIALVFHQLFEGLAMGARLADAPFKLSLELALMLVFSFSAPIGIAAGTGAVMASRDALTGVSYALVSAVLDAICGGIMLYIAFNLLFVDFPHDLRVHCDDSHRYGVVKRIGLYTGLWIGAGVMALIGKWL
ncbi:ZIP Zinc transporter [Novymonas esmeraldas]|uniref:ZIP Zinc transporter n=1 Tax=Novymonas esmeraldas TaxID=1808958 RepID=A0AAW0EVD6_9TRYP